MSIVAEKQGRVKGAEVAETKRAEAESGRYPLFPQFTQVPNLFLDVLTGLLNGSEVKVLNYLSRRTWGFHRKAEAISIDEICNGTKDRKGRRRLDLGAGVSEQAARAAIRTLTQLGIIEVEPQSGRENVYRMAESVDLRALWVELQELTGTRKNKEDKPRFDEATLERASEVLLQISPGLNFTPPKNHKGSPGENSQGSPPKNHKGGQGENPDSTGDPATLKIEDIQRKTHDAANAADDESLSLRDEGQGQDHDRGRRRFLERLLETIGDDHPSQAIDRALGAGWSLEELVAEVQRLAELNGSSIRNRAGWLRKMLPKGREALRAALDRYGAPRSNDNGGGEVERLKSEYRELQVGWHCEGTPPEEKEAIAKRGREVADELRRRGINVAALKAAVEEQFRKDVARDPTGPEPVGEIAYRRRFAMERPIDEAEIARRLAAARIELPDEEEAVA